MKTLRLHINGKDHAIAVLNLAAKMGYKWAPGVNHLCDPHFIYLGNNFEIGYTGPSVGTHYTGDIREITLDEMYKIYECKSDTLADRGITIMSDGCVVFERIFESLTFDELEEIYNEAKSKIK